MRKARSEKFSDRNRASVIAIACDYEAGKYADLIAVPGDPLKDITLLEQVGFVIKGGVVVYRDDLMGQ
jgi:hypothetical protein